MNIEIKGVHVDITDSTREYINKKMQRLDFASEHIMDLLFTLSQEKRQYKIDANIKLRWGQAIHVGEVAFDLFEGIDSLFDKMEVKINREKKKIQEHKGQDSVRTSEPTTEES
jgi:putative sigma-54 modulation protein